MGFISSMKGWLNIKKSTNVIHNVNKRKNKNHIITSIDIKKKVLRKIQVICDKNSANQEQRVT